MNLDDSFDYDDKSAYSAGFERNAFAYLLAQYKRAVYTKWFSIAFPESWQTSESIDILSTIYGRTDTTE
ncbi:hypothetical protein [Spirosoma agri]|uniref:Uncharacterized protein n=1 Tax=Spirosoma agri TaxID=1987381 RepID=A0A6M0IEG2_9BACT|nr:hypothetical protein [Spirosoma agri]NEU66227.1 hypothetical protein [Spirosoma agri]